MKGKILRFWSGDKSEKQPLWRKVFISASLLILLLMPIMSLNVGVNGDERFHFYQSKFILDFYKTFGKDRFVMMGAYESTQTDEYKEFTKQYLKEHYGVETYDQLAPAQKQKFFADDLRVIPYGTDPASKDGQVRVIKPWNHFVPGNFPQDYGSLFEFVSAIGIELFGNPGVGAEYDQTNHQIRKVLMSLFGFICILFCGLCARRIAGWRAGFVALTFIFLSPYFLGQSFFNIKDIPFATGYIVSVYFILRMMQTFPNIEWRTVVGFIVGTGMAINMRAGGLLMFAYLGLFMGVVWIFYLQLKQKNKPNIDYKKLAIKLGVAVVGAYFAGILLWPYGLTGPLTHPFETLTRLTNFETQISTLFDGKRVIVSDPEAGLSFYTPKLILLQTPIHVIALFFAGAITIALRKALSSGEEFRVRLTFILFTVVFPLFYIAYKHSTLYDGWRHSLFVFPSIVVIAAFGTEILFQILNKRVPQIVFGIVLIVFSFEPLIFIIKNHPVEYVYFNPAAGGVKGAFGKYETDYYMLSTRPAAEWLIESKNLETAKDTIIIGTDCIFPAKVALNISPFVIAKYMRYDQRFEKDWDYGLFFSRFVDPTEMKNKLWPPSNTVHTIDVSGVPVMAILERKSKADIAGIEAFNRKDYQTAAKYFLEAVKANNEEWMYHYYLVNCYQALGKQDSAAVFYNQLALMNPAIVKQQ